MSAQDKMERILKELHLLISDGEPVSGSGERVIINKKQMLYTLEKLNLAVYEIMDQYEVTSQSRELAQRRNEKKSEEFLNRVSNQAEDVYAASLIYTSDALDHVQSLMDKAIAESRDIWQRLSMELEREKHQVQEDQMELREQLQDFKDSNKYLVLLEDCNRERKKQEQKKSGTPEKRIQNEARHYAIKAVPEIKVNPAYFKRRSLEAAEEVAVVSKVEEVPAVPVVSTPADTVPDDEPKHVTAEVRVDLDSEYFKWKAQEEKGGESEPEAAVEEKSGKKERKGLWGKKKTPASMEDEK